MAGDWHGGSDASTRVHCFWYDRGHESDFHVEQFKAVWDRLHELTGVRDANGWPVVQLVFTRPEHSHPVIAYRFTSDWASAQHYRELIGLGGSLGRGVFDPLDNEWDFNRFVR